jgi:nucleotide-binding universal stress UspA family protein
MTVREDEQQGARRIVVTLDASACGRAALEAAAQLAAEMQAELQGLFVEDVDLLRLAKLPLASEIPLLCAVPRQLESTRIQCAFRAHAEKVRQAMAEAADRLRLRWSFQVLQGDVVRTSRALAEEAELLILGWAETAASGLSHGAQRTPIAVAGSILVIDEGSPNSDRVLRAAVEFAQVKLGELLVLSPAAKVGEWSARERQIGQFLQRCGVRYAIQPLPKLAARTIVELAERLRSRLLLLVLRSDLLSESEVEILVKQLECPLVLVP